MKKVPFCNLSVPAVLVGLTILVGAFLTLPNTNADDVVDQINITVPESCTVEGVIATGGEHTKTVQNNQYYSEIGTTTFKTYCNDNNGYAIYAVGYSNDEIGNTLMKHNASSAYDFNTGTATSGDTSNWAMKLSAVSGTYAPTIHSDTNGTFSSYHVIPSEYTKVVSFASNTDLPATGVNADGSGFTSTYAAWISATQPAGTYIGKVLYRLVHPANADPMVQPQTATSGCVNYFANASDAIGTMGCQSISESDTEATLLATNFSREGYGFAGWSDAYDYATNTNANFYGPNEDITFTAGQYTGTNNGLALYAVWIKSVGSIQSWSGCSGLDIGAVTALTDQRDNETYAVAKLADNNCWMIENLRLENTGSHNSDGSLAQGYGTSATYGNFSGLANPEAADKFTSTYNSNSSNSLYSNDGSNGTINIGTSNYPAYRMPRYNNLNTPTNPADRPQNPTTNKSKNDSSNAGMFSYGNYYTWHAAIADTTTYTSGNHNTTSICPNGWQIPLGDTSTGDINQGSNDSANRVPGFSYLDRKMGGSGSSQYTSVDSLRWRKYPNNFVYSGYIYNSVTNRGNGGHYLSSTAYSYSNGGLSGMFLDNTNVSPGTYILSKFYGNSIRCVVSGV